MGLPEDKIRAIIEWRDSMYRTLAKATRSSIEHLALTLKEASYKGDKEFEQAVVSVLESMGFKAELDGASGKKDILMLAPCGVRTYKLAFEAKGHISKSLPNDKAEISGADAHRSKAGAEHAVVVARKFGGFQRPSDDGVAVLNECITSGRVSIMEIEALVELMNVMDKYHYPLDMVKEVFTTIENPIDKLERINKFKTPLEEFDYVQLLEAIWEEQGGVYDGEAVPYRSILFSKYRNSLTLEDLERKLNAVYTMAYPLLDFDLEKREVALRQSPDKIADAIHSKLPG